MGQTRYQTSLASDRDRSGALLARRAPAHIRRWAFVSFALLAVLGISFSISVYDRIQAVLQSTTALAEQDIPTQLAISTLKADIVEQEPILYEYYATEDSAKFADSIKRNRAGIDGALRELTQRLPGESRLAEIQRLRTVIDAHAVELDWNLASPDTDWDAARESLRRITATSEVIKRILDTLLTQLQTGVAERAAQAQRLVDQVVGITFASCIGMVALLALVGRFVVRSLSDAWHQRRLAYFPERNDTLILSLSGSGELQYANPSARAAAQGLKTDGDPLLELLPPDLVRHLDAARMDADTPHRFEHTAGGRLYDCRLHYLRDLDLFHAYLADITEQRRAQDRIAYAASHDDLTGLPNRRALFADLRQEIRGGERGLIVLTAIDRYSRLIEVLGHTDADAALRAVAERLTRIPEILSSGAAACVYRLDRDSFCLRLSGKPSIDTRALQSATKQCFEGPVSIAGHEFFVHMKLGLARYPDDGDEADLVVKRADIALNHPRRTDDDDVPAYSPEMERNALCRQTLERALRGAIERNEMGLVYQPKLPLRSGHGTGVEALARWRSEELGAVSPAAFIPVAEAIGFIGDLGWWALRTAAVQWRAWQQQGVPCDSIAVNISVSQLLGAGFPARLETLLRELQVPASAIEIEITESAAMSDADRTEATLRALRQIGVHVSIDDFGTGYSSFAYLKRFAINTLKIDQSFIRTLSAEGRDLALVGAMIDMAHKLGLEVVAEGVETPDQLRFLIEAGCDVAQGYFISKPLDAADYATFCARNPPGNTEQLRRQSAA